MQSRKVVGANSLRSIVVSATAQNGFDMKMFVEPLDIYLHRDAVDFRKSIIGLIVVVEQQLELSPFSHIVQTKLNYFY
ncbi:MAG: hypothetical protein ACI8XG_000356 [Congregibacter sp.]